MHFQKFSRNSDINLYTVNLIYQFVFSNIDFDIIVDIHKNNFGPSYQLCGTDLYMYIRENISTKICIYLTEFIIFYGENWYQHASSARVCLCIDIEMLHRLFCIRFK